jgi:signal peptide peptidase-like 2B
MLLNFLLALAFSPNVILATTPLFAGKESDHAAATIQLAQDRSIKLHPSPYAASTESRVVNTLKSVPIGKSLQVNLVRKGFGCDPIPIDKHIIAMPFGLVLDRGNCTFETKLAHAEAAGAAALIVLNKAASLKNNDILLDMCSVYAHRSSDGSVVCDEGKECNDSIGKLSFKFSSKDKKEARCCIDVARSVGNVKNIGNLNQTIPFLFLSIPDARVLENSMKQASKVLPSKPFVVNIMHRDNGFDLSALCIWSIGVIACFISCYFAAEKERREAYKKYWLPLGDRMMNNNANTYKDNEDDDDPLLMEVLTWKHAVALLFCSGLTLLGLYALIKAGFEAMIVVMQFFFSYAVVVATYKMIFYPLLKRSCTVLHRTKRTFHICGEKNTYPLTVPVSIVFSLTLAIFWFLTRHASWNWILLDCLGLCVCCLIVQTMRIAGLRAATVLLLLFFLYDIFMVFITPSIFGDSVMVEVATGGGANLPSTMVKNTTSSSGTSARSGFPTEECVRSPGEKIPMLYMFPRFSGWPGGYSMLGYGDIVFPSILLSHVLRFDYSVRGRLCCWKHKEMEMGRQDQTREGTTYFPWLVIGYAVGLMMAFLANYFQITINGVHGQPALLYLVPCTLGTHVVLSWRKGEFIEQWNNVITSEEEDDDGRSGDTENEVGGTNENNGNASVADIKVEQDDVVDDDKTSLLA